jgi:hypothetical protein
MQPNERTIIMRYADVGITRIMPPSELCRIESRGQTYFLSIPVFPHTLMLD